MVLKNSTELAREFGRGITELKNLMRQFIQVKIKEHGLDISFELLDIMYLLWQKDGGNQQEIADVMIKDKSSMTYLIDNLVKRNLVKRVEDENDRRNKLIYLTEQGKQLQKQLSPWVMELYEKATTNISTAELGKAVLLVQQMNENLKKQ